MSWITIEHDGRPMRLAVARTPQGVWVGWDGRSVLVQPDRRDASLEVSQNEIRAPMTGKVVKVSVARGADVKEGDVVLIMEAMKMEYRLAAPHAGKVHLVQCREGDLVDLGKTLVTLG